ncbi:glycoside hydrolase family 36 protein [Pedobacter psychroterrae]|uniref:Alpha-galactosidase n=1 Tax=Pedobacter psychroterrae TaxID=2530453 RepID=A0A4R0NQH4_9SPHI|nr:glycoside hydrolase family 36 protein [Pedobacter psychroterrae]TCD01545.1 alpha-galactosidase [Pedobacter psychroterrae]
MRKFPSKKIISLSKLTICLWAFLIITIPLSASAQIIQVGNLKVNVEGKDDQFRRSLSVRLVAPGINELTISLQAVGLAIPKPIVVTFKQPSIDIQSYLTPHGVNASETSSLYDYELSRMIPVSYDAKTKFTSATMDQPSMTFFNTNSQNRLTIAASELIFPVTFNAGENEQDGVGFDLKIGLFEYVKKPMEAYTFKFRFDTRNIHYNQAQRDLLTWWKAVHNLKIAKVPISAHMPFYCTWYALKADGVNAKNIEEQARLARQLGCETIIVDDGWQKAQDAKAGYCLYNGDWEVDTIRFTDFKAHVKKVQSMNMKYMLWVGPSMIGEKSKIYEELKDKMLYRADWAKAWVADPRFPEVRKYLAERLITLMKETGIDGFKIDFMDLMNTRYAGKNLAQGNGRDYESVEEATVKLLSDIHAGCSALNLNVLIEFRQFYTSPVMQQFANMFRAVDCPNDVMENRTRTLDTRNLNYQVIHADPLAWNENENVQASALQLLHTMLSVPQVSTDLTKMSTEHLKMLTFLLKQWRTFSITLTRGEAFNYGADSHYTWSETSLKDQTVVVAYQPTILSPKKLEKNALMINGTHQDKLVLDLTKNFGVRTIMVYTCTGELVRKEKISLNGLVKIKVPASGIIRVL